ncbi:MAG: hypothetical protein ACREQ9_11305, partial [Candidatus Binatia bacterium]
MAEQMPWTRRLSARLGSITLALLAGAVFLIVFDLFMLASIKGETAAMLYSGRGRMRVYQILYLLQRLPDATGAVRESIVASLRDAISRNEERLKGLRDGDPTRGIPPAVDPGILGHLNEREALWRAEIKPAIERQVATASREEAVAGLAPLNDVIERYVEVIGQGEDQYERVSYEKMDRFRLLQYVFMAVVAVLSTFLFWIGRSVSGRARPLATTAERIAG